MCDESEEKDCKEMSHGISERELHLEAMRKVLAENERQAEAGRREIDQMWEEFSQSIPLRILRALGVRVERVFRP